MKARKAPPLKRVAHQCSHLITPEKHARAREGIVSNPTMKVTVLWGGILKGFATRDLPEQAKSWFGAWKEGTFAKRILGKAVVPAEVVTEDFYIGGPTLNQTKERERKKKNAVTRRLHTTPISYQPIAKKHAKKPTNHPHCFAGRALEGDHIGIHGGIGSSKA